MWHSDAELLIAASRNTSSPNSSLASRDFVLRVGFVVWLNLVVSSGVLCLYITQQVLSTLFMIDQSMSCRQPCGRVLSSALGHSVFVFFLFFFSTLWGRCRTCRTNYHPQEEWAKFGYRSDRKLEQKIQNPCLVLVSSNKYGDFRLFFSLKIWRLWLSFFFFPPNKSFVPLALDFVTAVWNFATNKSTSRIIAKNSNSFAELKDRSGWCKLQQLAGSC